MYISSPSSIDPRSSRQSMQFITCDITACGPSLPISGMICIAEI